MSFSTRTYYRLPTQEFTKMIPRGKESEPLD